MYKMVSPPLLIILFIYDIINAFIVRRGSHMADEINNNIGPETPAVDANVEAAAEAAAKAKAEAEALAEKQKAAQKAADEAAAAAKKAEEQAAKDAEKARIAAEKEAEKQKAEAEKEAEKQRIAAEKEAEKQKAAAEKEAEKQRLAAEKEAEKQRLAAEKEAEKQRIAQEKAEAKAEKKRQKLEAEQALINACPPQYKPVSTSKYFWFGFLSFLPCVGLIITIILSFAGRNRNVKRFERAILAYYIIGIILCLLGVIIIGLILPADMREGILYALDEILYSIGL